MLLNRHMGLAVDEEDSPSPPPPPPQGFFGPHGWPPLPMRLPPPPSGFPPLGLHLNVPVAPPVLPTPPLLAHHSPMPTGLTGPTSIRVKRQFDMASLLASEKKEEDIVEVSNNNNDNSEAEANEDSASWR